MNAAPPLSEKSRPEAKAGILDIQPYVPGKSKLADPTVVPVKLSSNENVLGSSPHAIAAHIEAASRLNLYPDSRNNALRAVIAEHFRLEPERLVFFANPSNPTGTILPDAEVRRLHAGLPKDVILVIDGAYSEFCAAPEFSDGLDLARAAENVIVTRTFSKLHGLAALRVGWAYGPQAVVEALDRIRLPFNVVLPGQDAAIAALKDEDFQQRSLELVHTWLPRLTQQLGGLGLDVTPSHANFLLVTFPATPGKSAGEAEAFLADRGLIVRGVKNYGLPDSLRITVGLEEHNRAVVDGLADFLKG